MNNALSLQTLHVLQMFSHGEQQVKFTDVPCLVGMIVRVAEDNKITKLSILKFTYC